MRGEWIGNVSHEGENSVLVDMGWKADFRGRLIASVRWGGFRR
jgi:hypothetical protein